MELGAEYQERSRPTRPSSLSVTFTTDKITETRAFYETHFGAKASFDCGWYVVVERGGEAKGQEIGLIQPQNGASPYAGRAMLNLPFADVDAVHARLTQGGVAPVIPLEDHPWGDRGFGVLDPLGTMVYCLTEIETSDEFKAFQIDLP